jgi:hypothetical protein
MVGLDNTTERRIDAGHCLLRQRVSGSGRIACHLSLELRPMRNPIAMLTAETPKTALARLLKSMDTSRFAHMPLVGISAFDSRSR